MVCSLGPHSVLSEAHSKSLVSWPEVPSSGNCSKMVSLLVRDLILNLYETRLKVVLPV